MDNSLFLFRRLCVFIRRMNNEYRIINIILCVVFLFVLNNICNVKLAFVHNLTTHQAYSETKQRLKRVYCHWLLKKPLRSFSIFKEKRDGYFSE